MGVFSILRAKGIKVKVLLQRWHVTRDIHVLIHFFVFLCFSQQCYKFKYFFIIHNVYNASMLFIT